MATREEAVDIAKGIVEAKLGDYYKLSKEHKLASALLALDERVRVLEQENSELRAAVIAVADSHESRRSIVREIAAYRSVANNLSKPFSIADVARRCEALATGEGKEG